MVQFLLQHSTINQIFSDKLIFLLWSSLAVCEFSLTKSFWWKNSFNISMKHIFSLQEILQINMPVNCSLSSCVCGIWNWSWLVIRGSEGWIQLKTHQDAQTWVLKMLKTDGKNYQDSSMKRNIQKNQQKMDSTFLRPMTFNNHSALLHSLMVPINVAAELNWVYLRQLLFTLRNLVVMIVQLTQVTSAHSPF